eukprot:TRINITY_DN8577_c0_g3_i1.p1 TRINITY_DN8577_c0_g3~~TRINITY_DN8577_c0_g3_i1.p1  ORF type:complete len:654 (-),score=150.91 TRINITY_DN8577_c0_g3_i1:138-2099(-)
MQEGEVRRVLAKILKDEQLCLSNWLSSRQGVILKRLDQELAIPNNDKGIGLDSDGHPSIWGPRLRPDARKVTVSEPPQQLGPPKSNEPAGGPSQEESPSAPETRVVLPLALAGLETAADGDDSPPEGRPLSPTAPVAVSTTSAATAATEKAGGGEGNKRLKGSHVFIDDAAAFVARERRGCLGCVEAMVESTIFEVFYAFLIVFNSIIMALELQFIGIEIGYNIDYPGINRSANDILPDFKRVFELMDFCCGSLFLFEVLAKVTVQRANFPWSLWNCYDSAVVAFWLLQTAGDFASVIPPAVLRLVRMARLLRLLRFAKTFEVFDVLRLLVRAVKSCVVTMLWSAVLLLLITIASSMFLSYTLSDDFVSEGIHGDERRLLYRYFGTFTRSFVSMFEMTFGNWVPISRLLQEEVGEQYAWYILSYRFVVGFSVVMVVRAIFISETLRSAQNDDEVLVMQKNRQVKHHTEKMELFFQEADESGDGFISLDEFKAVLENPKVKQWLAAQDINISDADLVFQLADTDEDEGESRLSAEELVRGLSKVKGTAKSMDMVAVSYTIQRMERKLNDLCQEVLGRRGGSKRPAVFRQKPPIASTTTEAVMTPSAPSLPFAELRQKRAAIEQNGQREATPAAEEVAEWQPDLSPASVKPSLTL